VRALLAGIVVDEVEFNEAGARVAVGAEPAAWDAGKAADG
jgi:hypothetical protein